MLRLVPVLSSQAGSCLTMNNWKEAGVEVVSYRLQDLIMKPGLATLNSLQSLRHYTSWDDELILNATLPPANSQGEYTIRNLYDGGKIVMNAEILLALINKLQPDKVLLPKDSAQFYQQYWQYLSPDIQSYFHFSDSFRPDIPHSGIYLDYDATNSFDSLLEVLIKNPGINYIQGNFSLNQRTALSKFPHLLVESDKPAHDGMTGIAYREDQELAMLDGVWENDHQLLDTGCDCQTCLQRFTRAYLHHLIQHTPLLAQRFLIGHNVYYYQNHLNAHHHLRAGEIPI